MQIKNNLEAVGSVLKKLGIVPEWNETRGRKKKYVFSHIKKGEIYKKIVEKEKAKTIQSAMIRAAKSEGVPVTIQNHGNYLLVKRIK